MLDIQGMAGMAGYGDRRECTIVCDCSKCDVKVKLLWERQKLVKIQREQLFERCVEVNGVSYLAGRGRNERLSSFIIWSGSASIPPSLPSCYWWRPFTSTAKSFEILLKLLLIWRSSKLCSSRISANLTILRCHRQFFLSSLPVLNIVNGLDDGLERHKCLETLISET